MKLLTFALALLVTHSAFALGPLLRYEYGSPSWNLEGKVSDPFLDPRWTANRHRVSANVTLFPTEFSRVRLQGSVDAAGWLPKPTYALMLACEFSIGAHGAHKF